MPQAHRSPFMMNPLLAVWMTIAVSSVVVAPAAAEESTGSITKAAARALEAELKARPAHLRPAASASRTRYVECPSGHVVVVLHPARLHSRQGPLPVTVDRLWVKDGEVRLRIVHDRLGAGEVSVFGSPESATPLDDVRRALDEILEFQDASMARPAYIGNEGSKVVHFRGANHLPEHDRRRAFDSMEAAEGAGYRKCTVCFIAAPPVPDYVRERALGEAVAAQFVALNPMVPEDQLHERVSRAGRRVLSAWPMPLLGYEYRFKVVEGTAANALACPAGQIFVTRGLLELVESDDELEAVLAHEIAHVERRHGYLKLRRAETAQAIGQLFALGVGAIAVKSGSGEGARLAMEVARLVASIAVELAVVGYGREFEEEADVFASTYCLKQSGSARALAVLLSKLQFAQTYSGFRPSGRRLEMTHPEIVERVNRARSARLEIPEMPVQFAGYDADGAILVALELEARVETEFRNQRRSLNRGDKNPWRITEYSDDVGYDPSFAGKVMHESLLFLGVRTSIDLPSTATVQQVKVESTGGTVLYRSSVPVSLTESDQVRMVMRAASSEKREPGDVIRLSIPFFPGVVRWEQVTSE